MGLVEKCLVEIIKVEKFFEFEVKLKDKVGYDIKVDIDWNIFIVFN